MGRRVDAGGVGVRLAQVLLVALRAHERRHRQRTPEGGVIAVGDLEQQVARLGTDQAQQPAAERAAVGGLFEVVAPALERARRGLEQAQLPRQHPPLVVVLVVGGGPLLLADQLRLLGLERGQLRRQRAAAAAGALREARALGQQLRALLLEHGDGGVELAVVLLERQVVGIERDVEAALAVVVGEALAGGLGADSVEHEAVADRRHLDRLARARELRQVGVVAGHPVRVLLGVRHLDRQEAPAVVVVLQLRWHVHDRAAAHHLPPVLLDTPAGFAPAGEGDRAHVHRRRRHGRRRRLGGAEGRRRQRQAQGEEAGVCLRPARPAAPALACGPARLHPGAGRRPAGRPRGGAGPAVSRGSVRPSGGNTVSIESRRDLRGYPGRPRRWAARAEKTA